MKGSSDTRSRIMDFIHSYYREKGYAPTVRDIARGCQISSSSVVQYHLNVLEKEGSIRRDPEVFRSIRLGRQENKLVQVPLLGAIAAGSPIPVPSSDTWVNEAQEMLDVPAGMTGGETEVFALKVKGTSMIDALVDDGDIVLLRRTSSPGSGDMVAAWLRDQQEVTLKRIYYEGGQVRLQPANEQFAPAYHSPDNVEVQGKVIGVLRMVGRG